MNVQKGWQEDSLKMKKLIFIVLICITSSVFANDTYLSCNVSGSSQSLYGSENFRPAQVTVEITTYPNSLFIIIDGPDEYIASASTSKRSNYQYSNLSDANKFQLTGSTYPTSGNIKSQVISININRISGLISVSNVTDFHSGNTIRSSYSGACSKVSSKKF